MWIIRPHAATDTPRGQLERSAVSSGTVSTASPPRPASRSDRRRTVPVLIWWAALTAGAVVLAWAADAGLAPTAVLSWPYAVGPALVAAALLSPGLRALPDRLPWPVLLAASFAAAALWTLALAAAGDRLVAPVRLDASTPPLAATVVEALGTSGPAVLALAAAATVPLGALTVRSLCGEPAGRELVPVLVLAPYAVLGTQPEALSAALGTAAVTAATLGSEPGRGGPQRLAVAVLSGLLLGMAALLGFATVLLGAGVVCVFFVRRRPLLNVAAAVGFLLPILAASSRGQDWTADLGAALAVEGSDTPRAVLAGALLGLLVLTGPALVASARSIRTTPGWPLLVAGALGVLGAVIGALAVDRLYLGGWLPALGGLLVAAVAPDQRAGPARPVGTLLLAIGVASAYAALLVPPA